MRNSDWTEQNSAKNKYSDQMRLSNDNNNNNSIYKYKGFHERPQLYTELNFVLKQSKEFRILQFY